MCTIRKAKTEFEGGVMKGNISINPKEFETAVRDSVKAVADLNTQQQKWEKHGEVSAALTAYAKEYYRLEQVMKTCKQLLEKDIKAVKKAAKQVEKTDDKLSKHWK